MPGASCTINRTNPCSPYSDFWSRILNMIQDVLGDAVFIQSSSEKPQFHKTRESDRFKAAI